MRIFSLLFHGLLALFLLAIAGLAMVSQSHTLRMEMLPWTGKALTYWLLFGALFGLLAVWLAFKRSARILLLIWSAAVTVLLVRGYFLSSYHFEPGEFANAAYLTAGSLIALAGAWFQFRLEPARKRHY